MSILIKRPYKAPSLVLSSEDSEKMALCEPGIKPSPDTESAGPDLEFPASRAVKTKHLIFISHSAWCSVTADQMDENTF